MALQLFSHPFSAYCWKVLVPLWENETPFEYRMLDPDHPENAATLARYWPVGKFPLLLDGDTPIMEASTIVEHLAAVHPGPVRLIPADQRAAVEVRMIDRIFDNYVMTPMQAIVADAMRPAGERDPGGVARARELLDTSYAWIDTRMADREFAAADAFSLADCAAFPALFYADWAQPIGDRFPALMAYRARLLARPTIARAVDEARPYRAYFPLGAPDRD